MIHEISEKQLLVLSWWRAGGQYAERDAIICDGAVRSGKSLFLSMSFVFWAMTGFDGQQFGICGKTILSLRRNVVAPLTPVLREAGYTVIDRTSRNMLTISDGRSTNTFHLFGGKDEGSAALIQGITLAGVLLDEVVLQPQSFVEQACARCSAEGSRFWFNCNPAGPGHWFFREWIQKAEMRNALYLHFTMADNPSLSPETRRRYENLYDGVFYRRFILGEWAAAEGQIYDFFDASFVQEPPEGELESYIISCDYGTLNPTSFGLWGRRNEVWYRVAEYYFDSRRAGRQKTDAEYVEDFCRLAGEHQIRAAVVDPSAASFIEALRRTGVPVVRARNDVVYGIRLTADLLKRRKIVICRPCADAIREFSLYVWDATAGNDTPRKENDHAMDEIRYFAATVAAEKELCFTATFAER